MNSIDLFKFSQAVFSHVSTGKFPKPSGGDDFLPGFDSPSAGALAVILARQKILPKEDGPSMDQWRFSSYIVKEVESRCISIPGDLITLSEHEQGVSNPLRNAKYLGSMKSFSVSVIGS